MKCPICHKDTTEDSLNKIYVCSECNFKFQFDKSNIISIIQHPKIEKVLINIIYTGLMGLLIIGVLHVLLINLVKSYEMPIFLAILGIILFSLFSLSSLIYNIRSIYTLLKFKYQIYRGKLYQWPKDKKHIIFIIFSLVSLIILVVGLIILANSTR